MKNEFSKKVKQGKIRQPHQMKFTIESWFKEFKNIQDPSAFDSMIFQAGIAFYDLFNITRSDLTIAEKNYPKASSRSKVKSFCGLSNRNFCLTKSDVKKEMLRMAEEGDLLIDNVRAATNSNNLSGQEILYTQVGNMTIDALQKALVSALKTHDRGSNKEKLTIEYLNHEAMLSNIYYVLEGMWEAVLYGGASFRYIPSTKEIILSERNGEHGRSFMKEKIRNDRHNFLVHNGIDSLPLNAEIVGFSRLHIVGSGRKKRIQKVVNDNEVYARAKLHFEYQTHLLSEVIPLSILSKKNMRLSFSMLDVLDVFKCIMLLAMDLTDNLPNNTDIRTVQSVNAFSTKININALSKSVSDLTGNSLKTVKEIVKFLTFDGDYKKDIWCHPLVKESESNVFILLSPFWSPIVLRLVEHWLEYLKVDFSEKGHNYEDFVADEMRKYFNANSIIGDPKIVKCKTLTLDGSKEEIDLIILIKNLIVVGEVKCFATADSSREYGQLMDKVSKGASQASRKADFLRANLSDCFDALGWDYSDLEQYQVQPIVIGNSCFGTSRLIEGVPIVDLGILRSYFSDNVLPILSTSSEEGASESAVSMQLYTTYDEAVQNFKKYVDKLPQYHGLGSDIEFFDARIEINSEKYSCIVQEQCKPAEITEDVMNYDYEKECPFPIIRGE